MGEQGRLQIDNANAHHPNPRHSIHGLAMDRALGSRHEAAVAKRQSWLLDRRHRRVCPDHLSHLGLSEFAGGVLALG